MHTSSTVMVNVIFWSFLPRQYILNLENIYKVFVCTGPGDTAMNRTDNTAILNLTFILVGTNIHLQSLV